MLRLGVDSFPYLMVLSVLVPGSIFAQVDPVELDSESGTFSRRLPFDVPYVITGLTPPGTTGVTVQYQEKVRPSHEFEGTLKPREAVVSGVDGQGRFSVKMDAVRPNRYFQFYVGFERRLPASMQLYRNVGEVTEGTEVRFRVFDDSTGGMFGFFNGVTPSDSNGVVTAEFTPGNTTERGEATIRGRVVGTEVSARVKVEIIDT